MILFKSFKTFLKIIALNRPIMPVNVPIITALLLLLVFVSFSNCSPIAISARFFDNRDKAYGDVLDFLVKYGYVPKEDNGSGALRSAEYFRNAIRKLQEFANIPVTGILDETTVRLTKKRRCGVPDIFWHGNRRVKRFSIRGPKWGKDNLTWTIISRPRTMKEEDVRYEISSALKIWSRNSKLNFKETRGKSADILISFPSGSHGDNLNFDGPGGVLAHAFFPAADIGGDTHFDADEKWVQNSVKKNGDEVGLFGVAAHEFGHSLGLAHSSVSDSLMFPYYKEIDYDFDLHQDDKNGIQSLYGSRTVTEWIPLANRTYNPRVKTPDSRKVPKDSDIPPTCNTNFDAVSSIRTEIFFFKGKYFWRLNGTKFLERTNAVPILSFWRGLPPDLEKIDAVYERRSDHKIMFFIGKNYWLFDGNVINSGFPKPLNSLKLPDTLEKVDAATTWGHNGVTYFFSGDQYWRFDEKTNQVEPGYPRSMKIWKGVPINLDAAFLYQTDGVTYFFKDKYFWKFDDRKMGVTRDSPQSSTHFWFRSFCENTSVPDPYVPPKEDIDTVDGASTITSSYLASICIFLSLCYPLIIR